MATLYIIFCIYFVWLLMTYTRHNSSAIYNLSALWCSQNTAIQLLNLWCHTCQPSQNNAGHYLKIVKRHHNWLKIKSYWNMLPFIWILRANPVFFKCSILSNSIKVMPARIRSAVLYWRMTGEIRADYDVICHFVYDSRRFFQLAWNVHVNINNTK